MTDVPRAFLLLQVHIPADCKAHHRVHQTQRAHSTGPAHPHSPMGVRCEESQRAVEAPNHPLTTDFPTAAKQAAIVFFLTSPVPADQPSCCSAIVTYILLPPSAGLELALLFCSDYLSICPANHSGDPLLLLSPCLTCTLSSLQYAYPPPQLSRTARLTSVLQAGPSRSPHKLQHQHRPPAGQHA